MLPVVASLTVTVPLVELMFRPSRVPVRLLGPVLNTAARLPAPENCSALDDGMPDELAIVAPLMVMVSLARAVPCTPPLAPPSSRTVEPVETWPVVTAPEPVVLELPTPPAASTA